MRLGFGIARSIRPGAAAIMPLLHLSCASATAQELRADAPRDEALANDEIVVTAQKRPERLLDVPIAMTAIGEEDLHRRTTRDLSDLAGAVPGLVIGGFTGGNASNILSIRGVAGQVLPIGAGQPVALYLDGVYLPRPDAAFFGFDDVERIEVLRGPQGALYGRNATAGVINVITRAPDADFAGFAEVSAGSFGSVTARGSVQAPLSPTLSASVSASHLRHDGFIRNTVTGNRLNHRDGTTVRAKLRYRNAARTFDATLSADGTRDLAAPVFKNGYLPGGGFEGIGDPATFQSDAVSESRSWRTSRIGGIALNLGYYPRQDLELASITSLRDFHATNIYDADASAAPNLLTGATNRSRSFSQELRANISRPDHRITIGANVFLERSRYALSTVAPTAPLTFDHLVAASDLSALAIYSQLESDPIPRVTLVAGLRYDRERRSFSIDYRGAPTPGPLLTGRVSDDVLIPSVGVNYRPNGLSLLYAKASRGYLAPGFNFAPGATARSANTFRAETLWAYEAGLRLETRDRRFQLEAAAFHYDYSHIQIRSTVGLGLTRVDNAAKASVNGVEVSARAAVLEGVTVGGKLSYLDATYGSFCQPISGGEPLVNDRLCTAGLADRSGNRLNLAPGWSGGLDASYTRSLGRLGRLDASVTYDFSSSVHFVGASNDPMLRSGSWGLIGARVAIRLNDGPEVFAFGRNLAGVRVLSFAARISPTSVFQVVGEPRTYGVGIGYRF